jgi:Vam6/Vps39-like protein vacuolar protein sorting-associated protein 39
MVQVWKEQSLLLCLNEEGVTGYRLPSFRIASQAGRTRGANRFALDEARAILCVAARKRLLLFHFDGKDFVELKELGLPDTVVSMAWCGDSICLGFKREYTPWQMMSNTNMYSLM